MYSLAKVMPIWSRINNSDNSIGDMFQSSPWLKAQYSSLMACALCSGQVDIRMNWKRPWKPLLSGWQVLEGCDQFGSKWTVPCTKTLQPPSFSIIALSWSIHILLYLSEDYFELICYRSACLVFRKCEKYPAPMGIIRLFFLALLTSSGMC